MEGKIELHVPSILASHFEKSLRHLAERTCLGRFHELIEDVLVFHGGLLHGAKGVGGSMAGALVESARRFDLPFLFVLGGADDFAW